MNNQIKLKLLIFFGTRPEAIKMAPIIHKIKNSDYPVEQKIVVTAQHRDMLDQVLEVFEIEPDYDLNIMQAEQTLSDITGRAIDKFESVIDAVNPDMVLVQGDTTTAFVGGLVAYYHKIPVGHVEAGLRSFDKFNPFPEEINRRLISVVSDLHFVPTHVAKANLLNEGINSEYIFITGNTVIDALLIASNKDLKVQDWIENIDKSRRTILLTTHRRENIGQEMENIFKAVREIVLSHADVTVVYPMHKNPKVRELAHKYLDKIEGVILTNPLNYGDLISVLKRCYIVLTDSGGIQEEAPTFGKPVLVLRKVTERPEGVRAGVAKVVGTDYRNILSEVSKLLGDDLEYQKFSRSANPYGDGKASQRLLEAVLYYFNVTKERPLDFEP